MTFCVSCGGDHLPDTSDIFMDFKGRRFRQPFHCLCCDKIIYAKQFAYGRACGFCDTGACSWNSRKKIPVIMLMHNLSDGYKGLFMKYSESVPEENNANTVRKRAPT